MRSGTRASKKRKLDSDLQKNVNKEKIQTSVDVVKVNLKLKTISNKLNKETNIAFYNNVPVEIRSLYCKLECQNCNYFILSKFLIKIKYFQEIWNYIEDKKNAVLNLKKFESITIYNTVRFFNEKRRTKTTIELSFKIIEFLKYINEYTFLNIYNFMGSYSVNLFICLPDFPMFTRTVNFFEECDYIIKFLFNKNLLKESYIVTIINELCKLFDEQNEHKEYLQLFNFINNTSNNISNKFLGGVYGIHTYTKLVKNCKNLDILLSSLKFIKVLNYVKIINEIANNNFYVIFKENVYNLYKQLPFTCEALNQIKSFILIPSSVNFQNLTNITEYISFSYILNTKINFSFSSYMIIEIKYFEVLQNINIKINIDKIWIRKIYINNAIEKCSNIVPSIDNKHLPVIITDFPYKTNFKSYIIGKFKISFLKDEQDSCIIKEEDMNY